MEILLAAGRNMKYWPTLTTYDLYVGVDRGAWYLLESDRPIDLAVGDFDSLNEEEKVRVFLSAKEILQLPAEKDDTDTQLALAETFKRYPQANITIVGATGGRIDHFLANFWVVFEPRFQSHLEQIIFQDHQNSIRYFSPGEHVIKKEAEMNYLAYCCLTPVTDLTLRKSKYTLHKQNILHPTAFTSNEFILDEVSFSFSSGIVAVIQSKD